MATTDDPPTPGHAPPELPMRTPGGEPLTLRTLPWAITDPDDPRALPPWFRRAVIMVILLSLTARVAVWGFTELAGFLSTLFFAFFLGLTMEPLVNRLAARGWRRGTSTFLVMIGLILFTIGFFAAFGGVLATQLAEFIKSLPDVLDSILTWINEQLGTSFQPDQVLSEIGIGTEDIAKLATNLGVGLLSVLSQAVGLIFAGFTILLFSFYFAADGPRFRRTIASRLSPSKQRTFLTVWDISTQKAGGYVISRGVMAMISAACHGVVFYVLDLPYWLPMALWVGMVSQFIPTIGTYLAVALPIIIALVNGEPTTALIVLIAGTVYQQIENYFVAPRVTKSTLEIHPAVAFGSVIVGSTLFGAMGALLAIPVVATVQSVFLAYGRRYDLVAEFDSDGAATDAERVEAVRRSVEGA